MRNVHFGTDGFGTKVKQKKWGIHADAPLKIFYCSIKPCNRTACKKRDRCSGYQRVAVLTTLRVVTFSPVLH